MGFFLKPIQINTANHALIYSGAFSILICRPAIEDFKQHNLFDHYLCMKIGE